MARFRYGALAAVALGVGSLGGKCDDLEDEDTSILPNASGGAGGSTGGGQVECPPAESCSVFSPNQPGAECMARRDNTQPTKFPGRRQMRSVWNRNLRPAGLATNGQLNDTLNAAVELNFGPECNSRNADANGGYILAFDWDTTPPDAEEVAYVGYVDRVPKGQEVTAREEGLCMAGFKHEATWTSFGIKAAGDRPPTFPTETWNVKPSRNQRLMADFTVADVRATRPLQEGEGIFYFDPERNSIHGYAHTTYIVVSLTDKEDALRDGTLLNVVPIREPELRIVFNDEGMNCAGRHRADALKADQQCAASDAIPGWGCKLEDELSGAQHPGFTGKCEPGTAAAFVSGYFKIADLERTVTILSESLCATYAGKTIAQQRGWGSFCSQSADWGKNTPNDPLRGGDWCSKENKAKDGTCIADSWKTETHLALQAFNVKPGSTPCTPKFRTPLD